MMEKNITVKNLLLSIIAISIVTVVPHLGLIPLPFGYAIPILLFVWLYLKYQGEEFSNIGFSLKAFHLKAVVMGSLIAILIFVFLHYLFFPLWGSFFNIDDVEVEWYQKIRGNTGFYIFILVMGWVVGGFYEEIVFHGFVFTRLEKIIPGKYATLIGFLLISILFGLYHIQLGTEGVMNAFLAGAGYHALTLYYKRNLWYGIFCHAAFDTIVITLLYLGLL